eukprot:m.198655 g.198655  ORF g.198655 m.198655 type:complete len:82 (+) comp15299_c0_seq1:3267-3512(+)
MIRSGLDFLNCDDSNEHTTEATATQTFHNFYTILFNRSQETDDAWTWMLGRGVVNSRVVYLEDAWWVGRERRGEARKPRKK